MNKKGGSINIVLGFQSAGDGSAIAYQTSSAPSDAAASVLESRFLSRRGASDWLRWQQLDPPLNVSRAIIDYGTHAVSPDFTHALVVTNRALTPGAIENGGNIYVSDLRTGSYESSPRPPGWGRTSGWPVSTATTCTSAARPTSAGSSSPRPRRCFPA